MFLMLQAMGPWDKPPPRQSPLPTWPEHKQVQRSSGGKGELQALALLQSGMGFILAARDLYEML